MADAHPTVSFASAVRDELAAVPHGPAAQRVAETSAMVRLGGGLHLSRGPDGRTGTGSTISTTSGAAARRLHASLGALFGVRPVIEVHRPGGLRAAASYRLLLPAPSTASLAALGILDPDGRPVEGIPAMFSRSGGTAAAYVRGALMVAGSISDPRRPAHLEVRVPGPATAADLVGLLARCGARGAAATGRGDAWRVVLKSGAQIGAVLAAAGAHTAFLRWDDGRLRRELRGRANRAVNADGANLASAVSASGRQVADIERALASPSWVDVPDDLRSVALARLANPEASLAELGALLDPPVGKATVHRRLARLARLARESPEPVGGDSHDLAGGGRTATAHGPPAGVVRAGPPD